MPMTALRKMKTRSVHGSNPIKFMNMPLIVHHLYGQPLAAFVMSFGQLRRLMSANL
ncbi:hypothetical protein [Novosphingobium sp. AAP83]|uniref:hypothetical protein n=1 Tax=Novosphingobium sp. AAP83 TaxID=1523425 RepID=UPI001E36437D|nr:hypothetical protein [Novosphingobium sp. AAP83]